MYVIPFQKLKSNKLEGSPTTLYQIPKSKTKLMATVGRPP